MEAKKFLANRRTGEVFGMYRDKCILWRKLSAGYTAEKYNPLENVGNFVFLDEVVPDDERLDLPVTPALREREWKVHEKYGWHPPSLILCIAPPGAVAIPKSEIVDKLSILRMYK